MTPLDAAALGKLSQKQAVEISDRIKRTGDNHFARSELADARKQYSKALGVLFSARTSHARECLNSRVFETLSTSQVLQALDSLAAPDKMVCLSVILDCCKTSSLAFRTTLNLAFCYHKLGNYNSSVRSLLLLLNELNLEMFEAICEGLKIGDELPMSLAILIGLLPKAVYRLCLSLRELKMYEKCQDKIEVMQDYLKKFIR